MAEKKFLPYSGADEDIYPEGAQAFRAQIEPFLARWQTNHPGEKPVFFHIGEPSELPPESVLKEGEKIYHDRLKPDFSYQPVDGSLAIRTAVAGHLDRSGISATPVTPEQIVVNGPGKLTFNAAARALRKPGLIVALFAPTYPGNAAAAMKTHLVPDKNKSPHGLVAIPVREENCWKPDPDELTKILDKSRPGLFILANPQNPTGGAFDKETVQPLVKYLQAHPDALVLEDAMYHKFFYGEKKYVPLASIPEIVNQVIIGDGASKDLRFTGARISWLRFPDALSNVKAATTRQLNDLMSCASTPECKALIPALSKQGDQEIDQLIRLYEKKKDAVTRAFKKIGLVCNNPMGAFYLMVKVPKKMTGSKFAEIAAEQAGVTLLPAIYFGASLKDDGSPVLADIYGKPLFDPKIANQYVRISYVGDIDNMLLGIKRLEKIL